MCKNSCFQTLKVCKIINISNFSWMKTRMASNFPLSLVENTAMNPAISRMNKQELRKMLSMYSNSDSIDVVLERNPRWRKIFFQETHLQFEQGQIRHLYILICCEWPQSLQILSLQQQKSCSWWNFLHLSQSRKKVPKIVRLCNVHNWNLFLEFVWL